MEVSDNGKLFLLDYFIILVLLIGNKRGSQSIFYFILSEQMTF